MILLRCPDAEFGGRAEAIGEWLEENAPDRAQAYFASMTGAPFLIVFEEDADAVAFKLAFADRLTFL